MPTSIYIHIPFCRHRCAYCDFNTYAGQEDSIPAYVEALQREIHYVGRQAGRRVGVHTVFFGGGTPSLLSAEQVRAIIEAVRANFELAAGAEITMEANPGTVTAPALAELRGIGVNRVSYGAQSANGEELRMLERTHSFLDVMEAVSAARRAGFDNLNLDLIYGLPGQSVETWRTTVKRVLDLRPEHISAYALTLEHGTPFGRWASRGLLPLPDPDAAADMYEWAGDALEAAGYRQYEISNWARTSDGDMGAAGRGATPDRACKHNLQYWRGEPYLGLGAGAHGYAGGYRYSNALRIKTYIDRLMDHAGGEEDETPGAAAYPMSPAAVNQNRQSVQEDMSEFMITGLRLTGEGIAPREFERRFGCNIMGVYGKEIEELQGLGLLERSNRETSERQGTSEVVRLTKRGRLLGNQVFMRFV